MAEFFTLESISSIIGMTAVIMLITQFTKGALDVIVNGCAKACGQVYTAGIPTKLWVVVLSEGILFVVSYLNYQLVDNTSIFLTAINGLVLAGIAMESYNALQSKAETPVIVEDAAKEVINP
jgi:hypothetical protein